VALWRLLFLLSSYIHYFSTICSVGVVNNAVAAFGECRASLPLIHKHAAVIGKTAFPLIVPPGIVKALLPAACEAFGARTALVSDTALLPAVSEAAYSAV
jgi:hypothetical protein